MRIIDRYILKSVVGIFCGCILAFLFLYVIIDAFSHLEEILKNRVALNVLWQYYLSFLPIIITQVAPFACLLSMLYTFGKLNRDNEIIALRSAGLSIFQITRTAFVFGIIVSLCVFWINDRFVPEAITLTQKIKYQIESGKKKTPLKESEAAHNLSMYGLKNRLYFINRFSFSKNTMEGIIILEHDAQQNIIKKVLANKGVYHNGIWTFFQSITYEFDVNGQIKKEPQYLQEEIMDIAETPQQFFSQRQSPDSMNIAGLRDYIIKLSSSGASMVVRNLSVDLYRRYAEPLTSVIIMLLGISFSLKMKKRATGLASIGISIMVGFLYYVLNAVSIALGKAGVLAPAAAAYFSHVFALVFSLAVLKTSP